MPAVMAAASAATAGMAALVDTATLAATEGPTDGMAAMAADMDMVEATGAPSEAMADMQVTATEAGSSCPLPRTAGRAHPEGRLGADLNLRAAPAAEALPG
ncbi:hypothetical protein SR39_30445 [Methylobacterium radiotolerans]|nr:hypothetical protein SR39_30445 [Methylobacterium radiotolerans]